MKNFAMDELIIARDRAWESYKEAEKAYSKNKGTDVSDEWLNMMNEMATRYLDMYLEYDEEISKRTAEENEENEQYEMMITSVMNEFGCDRQEAAAYLENSMIFA